MQTMQEIAVPARLDIPILFIVMNNSGWISIRDGQLGMFGRSIETEFRKPDGSDYSPHFSNIAREFGLYSERINDPNDIGPAVKRSLETNGPALLEIMIARSGPDAGYAGAWWDSPVPAYLPEQRREYLKSKSEIQFL